MPISSHTLTRRELLGVIGTMSGGFAAAQLLGACSSPVPTQTASSPTTALGSKPLATLGVTLDGVMRASEPNPKRGGILKTAWGATTAHYDIHQGANAPVLVHMYNGLVTKNLADGLRTILPDLAKSWTISPDGRTYTFTLRDGVTFHDGTSFTSGDVAATFNRIISPPSGIVSIFKDDLSIVEKVTATDPLTAQFVLKSAWSPFLQVLSGSEMVIYSDKTLKDNNYDLRKVIAPGTGAFIFKDHKVGEKWTLARNPKYWNPDLPYVDGLELLNVPAWTDRGTAVLTGQADFSWNVSPQTWDEGKSHNDIGTSQIPCLNSHTAIINNQHKAFGDPRIRRAIHLAVSRQAMIKALATQEPVFVSRWMPYSSPYSTPRDEIEQMPGYRGDKTADIAEARRLMTEAGYPNGFDDVDMVTASVPQWAEINAPAFQDELKRTLNINSKIRVMERGLLSEEYKKGDFDMLQEAGFESSYIDPTPLWNACLKTGGSRNWSHYSNPPFDKVLDQINVESNDDKRKDLFKQGMDLLDGDPPFYLIGFCAHSPMWKSYVKGLALDNRLHVQWGRLDTVWLDK